MNHRQQKNLLYKEASGIDNLQSSIREALRRYPKPENRIESLGTDGAEVRFIAYARTNQGALIGVFHKLTRGRAQEVIDMINGQEEWQVHLVTAKGEGKTTAEFIEGSLFFGVWKNHAVIHQSSSCRTEAFQEHLSWLLSCPPDAGAEAIAEQTIVALNDPLPPNVRGISRKPVRGLSFGGSVETHLAPKARTAQPSRLSFRPTGAFWKALKTVLTEMNADVPDEILLDESLDTNDLKVYLELYCTKKKAQTTAGQLLGALRSALSHSDAPYSVTLFDGTEIKGDQMKVKRGYGVDCVDHHPVHQSIFRCIIEYMRALVEDGTIIEDQPFGNIR